MQHHEPSTSHPVTVTWEQFTRSRVSAPCRQPAQFLLDSSPQSLDHPRPEVELQPGGVEEPGAGESFERKPPLVDPDRPCRSSGSSAIAAPHRAGRSHTDENAPEQVQLPLPRCPEEPLQPVPSTDGPNRSFSLSHSAFRCRALPVVRVQPAGTTIVAIQHQRRQPPGARAGPPGVLLRCVESPSNPCDTSSMLIDATSANSSGFRSVGQQRSVRHISEWNACPASWTIVSTSR